MSSLNLRLPDHIHEHIRNLAKQEGVSINQLITLAVAEKIAALEAESYLQNRAKNADKDAFTKLLEKVPNAPADEHDQIPEDLKNLLS